VALTPSEAQLADEAIARVDSSIAAAKTALDEESVTLVWLTGSSSARSAREESLRQSVKIAGQLRERRGFLASENLGGFLQLATAGAEVDDLIASSRRMTGSGFTAEVVKPTLRQLDPTNLDGPLGKLTLALVVVGVLFVAFQLTRD
jgi:hypothetical protein